MMHPFQEVFKKKIFHNDIHVYSYWVLCSPDLSFLFRFPVFTDTNDQSSAFLTHTYKPIRSGLNSFSSADRKAMLNSPIVCL